MVPTTNKNKSRNNFEKDIDTTPIINDLNTFSGTSYEKLELNITSRAYKARTKKGIQDGFKKGKVINEVLDKPTVMTLYKMIKNGVIAHVNGSVSAGKESVVFWGVGANKENIALKVYLVTTASFKKRQPYIEGDPRFSTVKKGTRPMVYLWAKKEFKNLMQCHKAGINVPYPIHVSNNVLATEFISLDTDTKPDMITPAQTLLYVTTVNRDDYNHAITILEDMYAKAHLVHGDYSEYNIFKTNKGLRVFDLGSAVDIRHPNAKWFLQRDINNITRFFTRRGILIDNDEQTRLFERITKR